MASETWSSVPWLNPPIRWQRSSTFIITNQDLLVFEFMDALLSVTRYRMLTTLFLIAALGKNPIISERMKWMPKHHEGDYANQHLAADLSQTGNG